MTRHCTAFLLAALLGGCGAADLEFSGQPNEMPSPPGAFTLWLGDDREALICPDIDRLKAHFAHRPALYPPPLREEPPVSPQRDAEPTPDVFSRERKEERISESVRQSVAEADARRSAGILRDRTRIALDGKSPEDLPDARIRLAVNWDADALITIMYYGIADYGTVRLADVATIRVRPARRGRLDYLLDWYDQSPYMGKTQPECGRFLGAELDKHPGLPAAVWQRLLNDRSSHGRYAWTALMERACRQPETRAACQEVLVPALDSSDLYQRDHAYHILMQCGLRPRLEGAPRGDAPP